MSQSLVRFYPFLAKSLGDMSILPESNVQARWMEYEKKGHHARESIAISEELGIKGALVSSLLGVGDVYLAKKEEDEVHVYYERSLVLAKELHHAMFITLAIGRIKRLTM